MERAVQGSKDPDLASRVPPCVLWPSRNAPSRGSFQLLLRQDVQLSRCDLESRNTWPWLSKIDPYHACLALLSNSTSSSFGNSFIRISWLPMLCLSLGKPRPGGMIDPPSLFLLQADRSFRLGTPASSGADGFAVIWFVWMEQIGAAPE